MSGGILSPRRCGACSLTPPDPQKHQFHRTPILLLGRRIIVSKPSGTSVHIARTASKLPTMPMTTRLLLVITYVHGLSARLPNTYAPHHELRNAIVEAAAAAEAIDHILEFSIAERANLMALRGRVRPRSARAHALLERERNFENLSRSLRYDSAARGCQSRPSSCRNSSRASNRPRSRRPPPPYSTANSPATTRQRK